MRSPLLHLGRKSKRLSLDPRITLRKPRASNQEGDLVVYGRSVLSRHLITQLWMWMSSLATKISPMVATQTTTRAFHGHGRQERSPLVERPLFEEVRYMSRQHRTEARFKELHRADGGAGVGTCIGTGSRC